MATEIYFEPHQMEAFKELNSRFSAAKQAVMTLDSNATQLVRDKRIKELTIRELDGMPADVPTYRAVGRCYLLVPKPTLEETLKDEVKHAAHELEVIEDRKKRLTEEGMKLTHELESLFAEAQTNKPE